MTQSVNFITDFAFLVCLISSMAMTNPPAKRSDCEKSLITCYWQMMSQNCIDTNTYLIFLWGLVIPTSNPNVIGLKDKDKDIIIEEFYLF